MTVVIALLGLLIVPQTIFRSLGAGAILVVIVAVLASLSLLPAILSLAGDNIQASLRDVARFPLRTFRSDLKPLTRVLTAVVSLVFFWFFVFVAVARGVQILGTTVYHAVFGKPATPTVSPTNPAADANEGGAWDRIAHTVMARPMISVVAVTALLVAAAIPYFDIEVGFAGVSTLPDSFQSKQGFEAVQREFSGGEVYPAEVVIDGDVNSSPVQSAIDKLKARRRDRPGLRPLALRGEPTRRPRPALLPGRGRPQRHRRHRRHRAPAQRVHPAGLRRRRRRGLVGGLTADNLDGYDLTSKYLPIVFVFVLALSFVLLMMVFRSIVVPAKAIIMNLLSVGAAYGLIVLVFQKGFGNEIFGFQQVETIEAWLPLFLFSVLFGLSMDYHVFLLSRIKERYDQTGDNTDAVAFGAALDRPSDHGRGADHGRGVRRLRDGRPRDAPADGLRPRRRRPDRRDDHPLHPRPGVDEAAGQVELVPAVGPQLAAPPRHRGSRARRRPGSRARRRWWRQLTLSHAKALPHWEGLRISSPLTAQPPVPPLRQRGAVGGGAAQQAAH